MDSVTVTASTLEKAQASSEKNLINLLLYHVSLKLELGNRQQHHPRGRSKPTQKTGVVLDLYYLMVAYGESGNEAKSHVLLGRLVQLCLRPMITELVLLHRLPSAHVGDQISLRGHHLEGRAVTVTLRHPLAATGD